MKYQPKIPFTLYSYLATEMLGPFFASFLIINSVFFVAKLIPFLNFVLELNIGFADFVRLLSYLFPKILLYTIPMSALLGVTLGFTRLSSDSEILALKASGISIYQILPPVLVVTTLIALLSSFVSIQLIPRSAEAMKQLSYQLLKEKISSGIQEHEFTEALGDVVVYVDKIDKATGHWSKVWVSDMRDNSNPIITMATSGKMISNPETMMVSLILKNGSLHKPGIDDGQIVQFDQYQIHIPLRLPANKTIMRKRSSLPMGELYSQAQFQDRDPHLLRLDLIEFHQRLALPVGCLLISLMGLPLGLQARPGKKALGLQIGFSIFILYYIFLTVGKDMAEKDLLPVWLGLWNPNILFSGLALFWIMRVTNELPLIPGKLFVFFRKIFLLLLAPLTAQYRAVATKFRFSLHRVKREREETSRSGGEDIIRGDVQKRVFHIPGCKSYNCQHCTLEFKNISIASKAGFTPCTACKKDIDEKTDRGLPKSKKGPLKT